MKNTIGVLLIMVMSTFLFADEDYAIRGSIHTNNVDKIQNELKEADKHVKNFEEELSKIVTFMDSYRALSSQQEREAINFTAYVRSHQKSLASCKKMELTLAKKIQKENISERRIDIKKRGIKRCKGRIRKLSVTYKNAKEFFEDALSKLNEIKEEYDGAAEEHGSIVTALEDARASYTYLESLE